MHVIWFTNEGLALNLYQKKTIRLLKVGYVVKYWVNTKCIKESVWCPAVARKWLLPKGGHYPHPPYSTDFAVIPFYCTLQDFRTAIFKCLHGIPLTMTIKCINQLDPKDWNEHSSCWRVLWMNVIISLVLLIFLLSLQFRHHSYWFYLALWQYN